MRKAFLSPQTVLTFIGVDDPAIGIDDDKERAAAIAKYARTLDQRVLKLQPGVEANKFFVRVLDAEQRIALQSLLAAEGVADVAASLQTDVGRGVLRNLVQTNVIGYRNFGLVTGFSDEGERLIQRFDAEVGTPIDKQVTEALLADLGFTINLLLFLMTAGQLSDDEKKA